MHDPSTIAIDRRELARAVPSLAEEARACCLVVYSGEQAGRVFALEAGSNLIGRAADMPLQLDSPGISRRHAELRVDGQLVLLRDLGSANGSYRNDQPVLDAVALDDGDLVRLGGVVLKFYRHRNLDAALHDRLYRLAMVDEGTGVFNRRHFHDALRRQFGTARTAGRPLAVLVLDLDHFKRVNDGFGHAAGDQVLRATAGALQAQLPPAALLARLGGEEFGLLLPGLDGQQALVVAERLRVAVAEQRFELLPLNAAVQGLRPQLQQHQQTVSIGLAQYSAEVASAQQLLELADRQVYAAKQAGRNQVCG